MIYVSPMKWKCSHAIQTAIVRRTPSFELRFTLKPRQVKKNQIRTFIFFNLRESSCVLVRLRDQKLFFQLEALLVIET